MRLIGFDNNFSQQLSMPLHWCADDQIDSCLNLRRALNTQNVPCSVLLHPQDHAFAFMSGSHLVADEFFSRNEKLELENENKLAMQQASGRPSPMFCQVQQHERSIESTPSAGRFIYRFPCRLAAYVAPFIYLK
jgi:hypothetical protein